MSAGRAGLVGRRLGADRPRDDPLAGADGVRHGGPGAPAGQHAGGDSYATLSLKAAALLHSLVGNHALVDGNRRLGGLATVVFLDLNRHAPDLDDDAAFTLVMDVAAGAVGVEGIATRLRVARR